MKPKITVIVPVYNGEKTLEKCLHSLWGQTYKNMEFIIINDGSSDNTKNLILEEIKNKNNVLYLENKENKGTSVARNMALEKATGDYIGYIDSDDYVEANYYESLMETLIKEKSDVVVCGINVIEESKTTKVSCGGFGRKSFIDNGLSASPCNKLIKKRYFDEYKFLEGKRNEDVGVIIPILIKANKVSYNNEVYYNYVQHSQSFQNKTFNEKRFDVFDNVDLALEKVNNVYASEIIYHQIISLLFYSITKEPKFWKRRNLLKTFHLKAQKYELLKNNRLEIFYLELNKIQRLYYKLLLLFGEKRWFMLENILIAVFNLYKKIRIRKKITKNITIEDIIKVAKKQKSMPQDISISVVIPNYNYERYLYQRIYSILNQKLKLKELIILDDYSTDNSRMLIDNLEEKLKEYINIKKIYNKKNSGIPFKQWQKGMEVATGDYVWIAEADDYSSKKFLQNIVKIIKKDKNIILAYCDTGYINDTGKLILKSVKKQIDIQNTKHWNNSYIINGNEEFTRYTYLNCTIANVSSVVFKKDDYSLEFAQACLYRQVGDWVFYASLMRKKGKKIAYLNKVLNYYRIHDNNVSETTKKEDYLKQIVSVYKLFGENNNLKDKQKEEINKRYTMLKKIWHLD